jgi:signal transduction histidine kinase
MPERHRSSFRRKLTKLSAVTSASTLLLAGFLFTAYGVSTYSQGLQRDLATEADIIGFTVAPALEFQDERAASEALAALRAEPQVTAARIVTADGRLFASFGKLGSSAAAPPPPSRIVRMDYRAGYCELTQPIGKARRPLGFLYLRADLAELKEHLARNAEITGAVLAVSLLAALAIALFLQREVLAPLLGLVDTARAVTSNKDYGVRAVARGHDELGVLVDAFNEMLDEIQNRDSRLRSVNQDLERRTEELARKNEEVEAFVYIVSHDLRAPLVNLQGFGRELRRSCEALSQLLAGASLPASMAAEVRELVEEEMPGSLRFISASTAKFDRLITALLRLSRSGRTELRRERIDMSTLLAGTLDSLRNMIDTSGATVVVDTLPPAEGDPTAVDQVFSNLVTNSLRYLQPGRPGRVEIGGEATGAMQRYFVRDNGVGISETARQRLFQVFQRFRPDLSDGEGIGLATIKRLVERHGGQVSVDSVDGTGTTFYFTLPPPATHQGDTHER